MKIPLKMIVEASKASDIVDAVVLPSKKVRSGKGAEKTLEAFNALPVEKRIAFLMAASDLSWFSRILLDESKTLNVSVEQAD
jgi:hypothetical protein